MFKRVLGLLLIIGFTAAASFAANDPFVGKWKMNTSKSKMVDQMKVTSLGANKYAFDFGGGAETIVVDGTDQPGNFATTLSVTAEADGTWKVVRKKEGRVFISATWSLSSDGGMLTDDFTNIAEDGKTRTVKYAYKRTGDGSGFAGIWVSTSGPDKVIVLEVRPYEGAGLTFEIQDEAVTKCVKFDGKEYPLLGSNAPKGFTSSGRRVNGRALELTNKIDGKIRDTQQIELSTDEKTLTMTNRRTGRSDGNVLVFEREQ